MLLSLGLVVTIFLGSVVGALLALIPSIWVEGDYPPSGVIASMGGALAFTYVLQLYLGEVLRAGNQVVPSTLFGNAGTYGGTFQNIVALAWVMLVVPNSPDRLLWSVGGLAAGAALCLIPLSIQVAYAPGISFKGFSRINYRALVGLNLSNLASAGLFQMRGHVFLWIGAALVSSYELASFSAASRLSAVFALPYMVISYVVSYYLVQPDGHKDALVEKQVRTLVTALSLASFPLLLVVFLFSGSLSRWILGDQYAGAGLVLILQSCVGFIHIVMGGSSQVLPLNGRHVLFLVFSFLSSLLGIAVLVPMAAWKGAVGISAASLVTVILHYILILKAAHAADLPASHAYLNPRSALSFLQLAFGRITGSPRRTG